MRVRIVRASFRLLGTGVALPGAAISNDELCEKITQLGVRGARRGVAVAERLGIRQRHYCQAVAGLRERPQPGESNPDLGARALRMALREADLGADDLGYLIGHTTTPHMLLPPNVTLIADRLDYHGPHAEFRQACTGFANALQMASGTLQTTDQPPVAIVGSETGSVYFDPASIERDKEQLTNFAMMGDAAGAAIFGPDDGQPGPRVEALFYGAMGIGMKPGLSLPLGGSGEPFGTDGEFGPQFRHEFAHIKGSGLGLFQAGVATARSVGIDLDRIAWVIPHQANGRMGEILAPALDIPREKFFVNADRVGNTGSAAIWVALDALRTSGLFREGDTVLVLGAEATKFMFGGFVYRHARGTGSMPAVHRTGIANQRDTTS
jgi:3-oxoacyl-[acyl-carrier-protein] synthase-3